MELNIPNDSDWMKKVMAYANKLSSRLNTGQANTSKSRASEIVSIDNLSGLIAESACERILKWQFGDHNVIRRESDSSIDQIDIEFSTGKTVEVRSSCVRNGIDFALFAVDKNNHQQYFDVIGPYSNGYKPVEHLKDYYMRVLYWCDKKQFMQFFEYPNITMYITGGATKNMMLDENFYQIKHLIPKGGQVQIESDYRVIPLAKSLDVNEFFRVIEDENRFTLRYPDRR